MLHSYHLREAYLPTKQRRFTLVHASRPSPGRRAFVSFADEAFEVMNLPHQAICNELTRTGRKTQILLPVELRTTKMKPKTSWSASLSCPSDQCQAITVS